MVRHITPKQVAQAIAVSESSVKRWCDRGEIPTEYTAGGHRRIAVSGLLQFLKAHKIKLAKAELLGLPVSSGQTDRATEHAAPLLADALLSGDEEASRRIVLDLFLAQHRLSAICDRVIAQAFVVIGDRWQCGEAEVFQERRACEIARRICRELQDLLPAVRSSAPLAIGGTVSGDTSTLPTTMAELVLRGCGWKAESLGSDLPLATLAAAIRWHRPRLFWLSCSYLAEPQVFLADYAELYEQFGRDVAFVVGGRALTETIRQEMRYAAFCDTMQHLDAFAQTLQPAKASA